MNQNRNRRGFTLIELLVVVLIIGILAAIALPQYMKAVEKSRASEAVSLLKSIINAEQIYAMANGDFTDDLTALDVSFPSLLDNSHFNTNNFNISAVFNGEGWGLAVAAKRAANGEPFETGDRAYTINVYLWTDNKAVWSMTTPAGANCQTEMCKAIIPLLPKITGD